MSALSNGGFHHGGVAPEGFADLPGSGRPPTAAVFRATDYGAVADPTIDNRAAIQAAIDAAHGAGGGLVVLEAGTFGVAGHPDAVGAIHLKDNVFLKGAGLGETVLRVVDGWDGKLTGIVRTPWGEPTTNYGLADLTLDGNRANTDGKVDGYFSGGMPGGTVTDTYAWLLRVEARNNEGYGFDPHERTQYLTIEQSVGHGNGLDGFVADYIIDGIYRDNLAYGNDRHGFNIVTTTQYFLLENNIARDNDGGGFVIQRGSSDIPLNHHVELRGGRSERNGRDGVLVQMSSDVVVDGVHIQHNATYGVRIMGASRVEVTNNVIVDNSASKEGGYAAVQIRDDEDFEISGGVFESRDNVIEHNLIAQSDGIEGRYAFEERDGAVDRNWFDDNTVIGTYRELAVVSAPHTFAQSTQGVAATLGGGTPLDDAMAGDARADLLLGEGGRDTLHGGAGDDTLHGGAGDDKLFGQQANDMMTGGAGRDTLRGGVGDDTLASDADNDVLAGNAGDDSVDGGAGADRIDGNDGEDALFGRDGRDLIRAGAGDDFAAGGADKDTLRGEDGNDRLFGDAGEDQLFGNAGNDTLAGGEGFDIVLSGGGFDTIVHRRGDGVDRLADFRAGYDRLDLMDHGFTSIDDVLALAKDRVFGLEIALGGRDVLRLVGVTLADLSAEDLIL